MNCQDQKRIMHSTGIEKNGNSTEKIIGGKEAKDGISGRFCVKKWVENQQIHREAAELEWEVPQVVVPIIHDEGQSNCFRISLVSRKMPMKNKTFSIQCSENFFIIWAPQNSIL